MFSIEHRAPHNQDGLGPTPLKLKAPITIDGRAANKTAIEEFNSDNDTALEVRQVKYLNQHC